MAACGPSPTPASSDGLRVELAFESGEAALGDNTLLVRVYDQGDRPMDAEVTMHLHMPAHGHDHGDAKPPELTRRDTGVYALSPVRFSMAGEWRVHVKCNCPMGNGEAEQMVMVR